MASLDQQQLERDVSAAAQAAMQHAKAAGCGAGYAAQRGIANVPVRLHGSPGAGLTIYSVCSVAQLLAGQPVPADWWWQWWCCWELIDSQHAMLLPAQQ
jgi:hypothetical protein